MRLFTHDKSETPTPRPITPNETCKKKKKKSKSTTFLIFQDYKEITIISNKVMIVFLIQLHTHTQTQLNNIDIYNIIKISK